MLVFDKFFNSPILVQLFEKGIYWVGTVWSYPKNMARIKTGTGMKREGTDFEYVESIKFTSSKLKIETLEQGMKYVQSSQ